MSTTSITTTTTPYPAPTAASPATAAGRASRPGDALKSRIRAGVALHVPYLSLDATEAELAALAESGRCDLAFIDLQHGPDSDRELIACCARAAAVGVPIQVRIRSPREAYLCGRACDFGALSVLVPLVEDPRTVQEAIEAFYYPPLGRRSWGPGHAYGVGPDAGPAYAAWWNQHGVLAIQLESCAAINQARALALPGVDLVVFGGRDLELDLLHRPGCGFASVADAIDAAIRSLDGSGVRAIRSPSPIGELPAGPAGKP